jgi:hypothetical protein
VLQQQQQQQQQQSRANDELPPADPLILDLIAQDTMRTINIDAVPREVRFYGDTAVVMLAWDDPREIGFQGGTRRVIFDDRETVLCSFNDTYRECIIDGSTHRLVIDMYIYVFSNVLMVIIVIFGVVCPQYHSKCSVFCLRCWKISVINPGLRQSNNQRFRMKKKSKIMLKIIFCKNNHTHICHDSVFVHGYTILDFLSSVCFLHLLMCHNLYIFTHIDLCYPNQILNMMHIQNMQTF